MILLYNTLTRKKETFEPLTQGYVSMYHCGPTVYNYAHIGNLRAYVFADTLRRMFEYENFKVNQIINITDVGHLTSDADEGEDKVEKSAKREGKSAQEITSIYIRAFYHDMDMLNIERADKYPRATEHIPEQIALIKKLEAGGHAYRTSDGIYFDTSTFPEYGALAQLDIEGLKEGARIEKNPEKRNVTDFALWKFSPKDGAKREQEWESPWGLGFPGWHIECSAMSMKYLGETFDIHTGGIDHIPVHHTNEIAQSESSTGKPFVHYWMHSGFVNVPEGKMAKSTENFIRLKTLVEKGISPLAYRYWLLTAHYTKTINFTEDAVKAAQTALEKLYRNVVGYKDGGSINSPYQKRFAGIVSEDLDTPRAIALVWELVKDDSISSADKKATLLDFDRVLGLDLTRAKEHTAEEPIPEEIKKLAEERESARKSGDFAKADELRKKIASLGYEMSDTKDGFSIKKST
ncbi:MAG: cysteine--tRNA ligase [Candidatus Lloydbacteria bacterium]|nr:cysteine--tRNA ligase [Candidatus Lloydbacteria bacterium]